MLTLGIDLAWATKRKVQAETGVAAVEADGSIVRAGWTVGIEQTVDWIESFGRSDALVFVDAPLVVTNPPKTQRDCENQVGKCYGRWKVACNSTNVASANLGGVELLSALRARGWRYDDGFGGPPSGGRVVSECYPYTTLVGVDDLRYDAERPRYKRKPKPLRTAEWRPLRAQACDELIARLSELETADPPLLLASHPVTRELSSSHSPLFEREYKHREDLIDAVVCAWGAQLWLRHGFTRSQVLGTRTAQEPRASIIAPARDSQRRT